MKLIEKFKYFIVSVDYLISKSFFYKQSRFKDILIDYYYSITKRISNFSFEPIEGNLEIDLEDFDSQKLITKRSESSNSISLDYVPDSIKSVITKHKNTIESHLGKNFLYEKPMIYENFNIDKKFSKYDVYSNIWHMDSHDGIKIIKIFILLHEVKHEDGPLIYLSPTDTKKNWNTLRDRWTYDKKYVDHQYEKQMEFIGKKGSYLLLNTSISSHRASIPKLTRKILYISLYPSWRKKKNRICYEY